MSFKIIFLPNLQEKPLSAYTEYTYFHSEDKREEKNEQGRESVTPGPSTIGCQSSLGESSSSHQEGRRKGKETRYTPFLRSPPRKAAQLAEAFLRAETSQENLKMKQKKKSSKTVTPSQKRKISKSNPSEHGKEREGARRRKDVWMGRGAHLGGF